MGRDFPLCTLEMCAKLPAPALQQSEPLILFNPFLLHRVPWSCQAHGLHAVSPQVRGLCKETMTTDEAAKGEGEVQAVALAERGEDITPARDRGVLKVRGLPGGSCVPCSGCAVVAAGCMLSP